MGNYLMWEPPKKEDYTPQDQVAIIGRITSAESSGGRPQPGGPSRADIELSEADKRLCFRHRRPYRKEQL